MSPTIRVDEEVYRALQNRAEPFVDTPNTVLRRMLDLSDAGTSGSEDEASESMQTVQASTSRAKRVTPKRKKNRTRAPSGSLLSQEEYELPLLETLAQLGGSASAGDVIEQLGARLNGKLKPADYEKLDSGSIRWENRAQFVRYELVQRGDMKDDSPRGVWEISAQGRRRLSKGDAA